MKGFDVQTFDSFRVHLLLPVARRDLSQIRVILDRFGVDLGGSPRQSAEELIQRIIFFVELQESRLQDVQSINP